MEARKEQFKDFDVPLSEGCYGSNARLPAWEVRRE